MKSEIESKGVQWIDFISPSREDARQLFEERGIPLHFINELISNSERTQIAFSENTFYVVMHFPKSYKESNESVEIDFIIGKDFLITAHYENIATLDHFRKTIEVENTTGKSKTKDGFSLFSEILNELYEKTFDDLEAVEGAIKAAETKIFSGQEKHMVFALSNIARSLINFRKAIDPHRSIISRLFDHMTEIYGRNTEPVFKNLILNSFEKVETFLKNQNEILLQLQDTNAAMLSTKQNEIMKSLTIVVFLTLPVNLIALIFTIPAENIPVIGHPLDFWIIFGGMLFATMMLLVIIRSKKWI